MLRVHRYTLSGMIKFPFGSLILQYGGDLLLGLSMVLFALRGQAPEWVTFAFANVLMFVGVMMRIQSLRRELGRPLPLILMVAAPFL